MAAASWFDAPANIDAYRRKTPMPSNCSSSWHTRPAHHRNPSESVLVDLEAVLRSKARRPL